MNEQHVEGPAELPTGQFEISGPYSWPAYPFDLERCEERTDRYRPLFDAVAGGKVPRIMDWSWDAANWNALFHFLRNTGRSVEELQAMNLEDIRQAIGTITISGSMYTTNGPMVMAFIPEKARPLRPPPKEARIAWELVEARGFKQTEAAQLMSKELLRHVEQYEVSRWKDQWMEYIRAGGSPEVVDLCRQLESRRASKHRPADPKVLDNLLVQDDKAIGNPRVRPVETKAQKKGGWDWKSSKPDRGSRFP